MNVEQVGYFLKRNMPTILSIGAAVGVVVSNILTNKASIRATLKVDEVEQVLDLLTKYEPKEEFIDADFTPVDEDKFADIDEQVTLEV